MAEKTENLGLKINDELCFHCGLPVRKGFNSLINNENKNFCCFGCKTACELIYSVNAGSYYKNRNSFSESPVKNDKRKFPIDSEIFRKQYINEKNGLQKIILHLDNLHCPSCIWVVEKVLGNIKEIKEINVNLTTNRVNITWDENKVSLQYIINTLVKIGYPPVPVEKTNTETRIFLKNKSFFLRMAISAFGMLATMFLAEPTYSVQVTVDPVSAGILQYMALIISTPVFFYTIWPYFKSLLTALRFGILTMDLTIFLGAAIIYSYSTWASFTNHSPVYFDCLTMFLFLITLGRFIESSIQQKIFHNAEQNIRNYPKQATVIRNYQEILIHTDEITVDELIMVRPGEQIPVDGIILDGVSHIDESVVTGESRPIRKDEGDSVMGGSVNLEGAIYIKATKISSKSNLIKIGDLAENINAKKSQRQNYADKAANFFISIVLIIAIAVFLFFVVENPEIAVTRAMAVLIVSCPCALGLAIPTVLSISGYYGIKKGILFKNADSFENLSKINHMVFDKTGTLTLGKMTLKSIKSYSDYSENQLLEIASGIERFSEHPLAWPIVTEANHRGINILKAHDFISFPGKGVKGYINKKIYLIGNLSFLKENGLEIFENIEIENFFECKIFIAEPKKILGCFILEDQLKENVINTIKILKNKKINLTLLSGDRKSTAEKVAFKLGISNILGEVLPFQKAEYISVLKKQGNLVAMAGDGINDAPAMAEADVGIAMCTNNNLANINADIVILNPDFSTLIETINIARKSNRIIKQNLFISFLYNLTVIPFAVTGFITPFWAAILMPSSSLIVLLNSLRLGK